MSAIHQPHIIAVPMTSFDALVLITLKLACISCEAADIEEAGTGASRGVALEAAACALLEAQAVY